MAYSEAKHLFKADYERFAERFSGSTTYSSCVGFDLVKLKVSVESIDWDLLDYFVKLGKKFKILSNLPEDHIKHVSYDENNELCVKNNKRHYSYIQIEYRSFSLVLRAASKRLNQKDIYLLSVYVVPTNHFLGNINNCSCSDLQKIVSTLFKLLRSKFGIYLKEKTAVIYYFELNRNYPCEREVGNAFIPFFEASFVALEGGNFSISPKNAPWGMVRDTVDRVGIFADASTIAIHVYNKIWNTEEKKKNIRIDQPDCIYRVEFVVKKEKQVKSWLSTANLFELKQEYIEDAYTKYLNKYVIDRFNKHINIFYEHMINEFDGTHNRKWADDFSRAIIRESKKMYIDRYFLTPEFINKLLKEFTSQSPTIKKNLSRCKRSIEKKLGESVNDTDFGIIMKELLESEDESYTVYYTYVTEIKKIK